MIVIKTGDITLEEVDVIVNAANPELQGGGGVDGAIHAAAGPSVMEECRKIGKCPTGQAVITSAGNLKAQKIIHAVGPVWEGGEKQEPFKLRNCYRNVFLTARNNKLRTIALPCISTGSYNFPVEKAAEIALTQAVYFQRDFQEIRFVCFSETDNQVYEKIWQELKSDA